MSLRCRLAVSAFLLFAVAGLTPALAEDGAPGAPVFATLAEAVAAQDVAAAAEDESVRCLASAVYYESKGEPLAGQLAVAQVILHRTKSGRYPSDVCGVVKQRGQFSFVRGGVIPAIDAGRATWRTAVAVARVALDARWNEQVRDALYFNGIHAAHSGAVRVASIGRQSFYR